MGNEELQIDKAHAKIFARAIYRDIAAYIDSHQEEYQAFLREEMEAQYAKTKTTHRPSRGEHKAD